MKNSSSEGLCEMCGHYVSVRQKAHILAEGKKTGENLLMLCPSCHIMFDTHIKPKLFMALRKAGITEVLPIVKTKNRVVFGAWSSHLF